MGKKSLDDKIREAKVLSDRIKRDMAALAPLKDSIKADMLARNLTEYTGTGTKCTAKISDYTTREYDVEKLRLVFPPDEWDNYCPRKADGTKIGSLFRANADVHKKIVDAGAVVETVEKRIRLD